MKKLFLVSMIFIGCASAVQKEQNDIFSWGGSPENPSKKPMEHFYYKKKGKASAEAISKASAAMMKESCKRDANSKDELIKAMVESSLANAGGITEPEEVGKKLIENLSTQIPSTFFKECIGIAVPDAEIPGSEFKECECVNYIKFTGGRAAVVEKAKLLEK
jgi:hypothetical protein